MTSRLLLLSNLFCGLVLLGCGDKPDAEPKEAEAPKAEKTEAPKEVATFSKTDPAPAGGQGAEAFAAAALAKVEDGKPSVQGDDEAWFFLNRELKQLGLGAFWEKDFAEVATNKTDPTASMVEFHELLKEKGVDLIAVPIPAKGAIYPEKVAEGFGIEDPAPYAAFYEKIRGAGVNVLDFEPIARGLRKEGGAQLYCAQDTHFSPYAAELIAKEIAGQFPDLKKDGGDIKRGEVETLTFTGDQIKGSEWEGSVESETLPLTYAGKDAGGTIEPVAADDESPILLIGDSHTLVFSEGGDMHAKGAGLRDQLQAEFGMPLAHVGVRGSGLVQARRQLYQRAAPNPTYWDDKKLVIWVFSVREFTQSYDKLISIPIEKK